MNEIISHWACIILGHKWDGSGYWLEYIKPTKKNPLGHYHDLEICARCKVVRFISDTFTLKEYREWMKK